ncbi:MAG: GAF domain-containing protein, partial [Gemmatimonadota bacterium]|nr:GAF domain-containing protein [Gemmatimonadota bacterium]
MLQTDKTRRTLPSAEEKEALYRAVREPIEAVVAVDDDLLAAMCSIACILHHALPHYYWTGFYRRVAEAELLVGPYQGTLGCLRIPFSQGVCGAAARERATQIVPDVRAFPGHIACDAISASEIVVPVLNAAGELIAVFDVDSDLPAAFDETDRRHLEEIVAL